MVLLAAYYSYNMQYPKGLSSFFTLLEVKLCGMKYQMLCTVLYTLYECDIYTCDLREI